MHGIVVGGRAGNAQWLEPRRAVKEAGGGNDEAAVRRHGGTGQDGRGQRGCGRRKGQRGDRGEGGERGGRRGIEERGAARTRDPGERKKEGQHEGQLMHMKDQASYIMMVGDDGCGEPK